MDMDKLNMGRAGRDMNMEGEDRAIGGRNRDMRGRDKDQGYEGKRHRPGTEIGTRGPENCSPSPIIF